MVEVKQPLCFVAENVKGILTLGEGSIIEAIIEDFSLRGYDVYQSLVNAADYEVPQDRWRVILIGFRVMYYLIGHPLFSGEPGTVTHLS